MANPVTQIDILNVPFNFTQQNVFNFNSVAEQTQYFSGRVVKTIPDNVVVKDTVIHIDLPYHEVDGVGNYVRYKNKNKWYYGFIRSVRYENEYVTIINFEIDAWQTYMFDITVKKSFVEREHVSNDTIGSNIVSEPFNYPKFPHTKVELLGEPSYLYLAVTFSADMYTGQTSDEILAGIVERVVKKSGVHATGGETLIYSITNSGLNALTEHINKLADKGANTISGMQEIPQNFFTLNESYVEHLGTLSDILTTNNPGAMNRNINGSSMNDIFNSIGYTPKNNKLYTDQFLHWEVYNNAGSSLETYPSDTNYNTPNYKVRVRLSQNSVAVAYCNNQLYNKLADNIATSPLDNVNWVGNNYAEYLARNKNTIENNRLMNNLGMIAGVSSSLAGANLSSSNGLTTNAMNAYDSGVVGGVAGGISNILSTIASESDMQNSRTGNRGSQSNGSVGVIYANKLTSFGYSFNKQDLQRADLFLDRYGYQVNMFKIPNHKSRSNFNYIKTSECNIVGAIPSEYLAQIINMYNSGFTIWHGQDISRKARGNSITKNIDFNHYMDYSNNEIRKED